MMSLPLFKKKQTGKKEEKKKRQKRKPKNRVEREIRRL